VADFRKANGHDPDQFAAQAYDALKIMAAAIDRAGAADPAKLRDALMQTKFDGVMGPFSFTSGRDPASTEGVVVLVMQNGKFTIAP
jgi:branched-chain amino acid transport system substrate-binding protein